MKAIHTEMAELGYVVVPHTHINYIPLREAFINQMREATKTPHQLSSERFPGSMAVSLSRRHLGMIARNDYVALEKSDGQRYMLFALKSLVVLIDRRMNFYAAAPNPRILVPEHNHEKLCDPNFQPELHDGTILDGELVFNQITNDYEYLIYDAVAINGDTSVATKDFRERMMAAEVWVVSWRVVTPEATGLLRLRCKDYFEKREIRRLFHRIKKDDKGEYVYLNDDRRDGAICNFNDGVIFTPVGLPYTVKNCEQLLKWKPPHLDSVDFKLLLEPETDKKTQKPSCRASIAYSGGGGGKGKLITLRQVYFPTKQRIEWAKNFHKYHESIVELSYDRKMGEWRYIRQREDKTSPNFASTVIGTMESIAEELLREELVAFLEKNSQPPPREAEQFIVAKQRTEKECKARNDLFDSANKQYLLATPISTTAPPLIQVPRRERRHRNHQRPQHQAPPQEGSRLQPDYSQDV